MSHCSGTLCSSCTCPMEKGGKKPHAHGCSVHPPSCTPPLPRQVLLLAQGSMMPSPCQCPPPSSPLTHCCSLEGACTSSAQHKGALHPWDLQDERNESWRGKGSCPALPDVHLPPPCCHVLSFRSGARHCLPGDRIAGVHKGNTSWQGGGGRPSHRAITPPPFLTARVSERARMRVHRCAHTRVSRCKHARAPADGRMGWASSSAHREPRSPVPPPPSETGQRGPTRDTSTLGCVCVWGGSPQRGS